MASSGEDAGGNREERGEEEEEEAEGKKGWVFKGGTGEGRGRRVGWFEGGMKGGMTDLLGLC